MLILNKVSENDESLLLLSNVVHFRSTTQIKLCNA